MPSKPYLIRLSSRLNSGLVRMDGERRHRHRFFIQSQQQTDGGFSDREGDSDIYYTGFAIRGLSVLGGLRPDECESLGQFIQSYSKHQLNVVDLVSWLYSTLAVQTFGGPEVFDDVKINWGDQLTSTLESVRTKDGGYAKTREGATGSTYHSFLVALTYELIGRSVPNPNALVQFIHDRQRDDGGFVEIEPMSHSGTNPTAAAVALLLMFDAMNEELRDDVHKFLQIIRSPEGGFKANARVPYADGLSTFTGLLTAHDLGIKTILDPANVEAFVTNKLELPAGGFRAASWDNQADVEYTFYGLGALGLLWTTDE